MKNLKIAIIDSGVRLDHPKLCKDNIYGFSFCNGYKEPDFSDVKGHGTAIYGIVRETIEFADIINIKIVNQDDSTSEEVLIGALEYLYEHEKLNLINISAGINICNQYNRLKDICDKLTENGTIIVSSFDNSDSISYPAAFHNVIGVTSSALCSKNNDVAFVENSIINVCGKGGIQRLYWIKPDIVMMAGNSFASAHITVEVARIIADGACEYSEILNKLKEKSKCYYTLKPEKNESETLKIKKAALFPFNKEMHSVIRFSDLLSFEIVDVFDIKYSPNVGATTNHLLKEELSLNYLVKNINLIEWDKIDTLIMGHLDELSAAINQHDLKTRLLTEAAEHNVSVYAFDDISPLLKDIENKPNVFYPKIDEDDLPTDHFGKLYRISKPVVGIFGTSSRQGKFTLQLTLRRKFLEAGYQLGQIGTEPSALLYGMDSVFPMGYNSSVSIKEFDVIRYLNSEINKLCRQDKELIIVGSQSGTIQYDVGNTAQFNIPQYEFLIGTQPDCVILCVNPYDEISFVERTIRFIESSVECKVISIVIFPMDFKYDWAGLFGGKTALTDEKYQEFKNDLKIKFKIPVYKLGNDNDMTDAANGIAEFFAT